MTNIDEIRARLAAHKQAAPVIAVLWADTPTHERIDLFLALYSFYDQWKRKRWVEVDFMGDAVGCEPYWRWIAPGFTSPIEFDWWMPRPDMAALDGTAQKEADRG